MNDGDAQKFSPEDCYSLLELLDKLGKDGVSELVAKGKPRRITQGDMIYFFKSDINRILGDNKLEEPDSIIIDADMGSGGGILSRITFKQSLVKRYKVGDDEEIYTDRILDLSQPVAYGRSEGNSMDREHFRECGIISSLHGKLFLDEEDNLLYENLGTNKTKIRGPKEKSYTILEQEEIGVLMASDMLQELLEHPHSLKATIKLGFQVKPHFVIRIQVSAN